MSDWKEVGYIEPDEAEEAVSFVKSCQESRGILDGIVVEERTLEVIDKALARFLQGLPGAGDHDEEGGEVPRT